MAVSETGKESLIPVIFNGHPQFPNKNVLTKTRVVQDSVEKKFPVVPLEDDPLQQEWKEFLEDFPHCSQYLEGGFLDSQFPALRQRLQQDGYEDAAYQVDVKGFDPEDITVKVTDGNVSVIAKKEKKLDDGSTYVREELISGMRIPEDVDMDQISTEITPDLKLRVSTATFHDSRPCSSASADSSLAER